MSMKKILMAAAAVTALTAGAANAATIDVSGAGGAKIGSITIGTGTGTGAAIEPYTLANELNLSTSTVFGTSATPGDANNLNLVIKPSSSSAIGIGSYLVTLNITNGTFDTGGVGAANLVTTGGTSSTGGTSTVSGGTISFIVNCTAGNIADMTLKVGVKTGTVRGPITVGGSIVTLSGAAPVDGGTISPVTIVDYRDGLTFAATAVNQTLSLQSGFKKFGSGSTDTTEVGIAKAVKLGVNAGTGADTVYKTTTGTAIATTDATSAVLTLTGDLSAFVYKVGGQFVTGGLETAVVGTGTQGSDTTAAPGVITLAAGSTNLGILQAPALTPGGTFITLSQKTTPVVGVESSYSVTPTITMATGFTPTTFAAKALGTVSFEGTPFYAAWVGDGTNGITYSIRLGNRTSTAISSVRASLMNPAVTGTSGTVASTASCEVGPIPASGELIVSSDTLKTCFGAFKRSDVRLVIQSTATNMTAKMRTVSAGMVTEAPLGGGSTAASTQ